MSKLGVVSTFLGSFGFVLSLSANAELSDLSGVAQVVPASVDETVQLGMPFNAMSGQFQHYYCINNGDIDRVAENAVSVLTAEFAIGVSESEIRRYLSGSVETNFDNGLLDGIAGANASAGLVQSLSDSETAISYSFGLQQEKAVETLTVSDVNSQLSSECLDLITQASDTSQPLDDSTLESLGTHLLTEISYGASLFVNLKISARTAAEKEEISEMLDVNYDVLDVIGDLSILSEKTRSNTIVEVYAHQLGGEPERMPEWLSAEEGIDGNAVVARCDLNNFALCRDVFNEIINYAKDDFEKSLVDAYGNVVDRSKLARLSYHVTPLESEISGLVAYTPPDELSQHVADESGNLTEMLQAYEAYSEKLSLVENAISFSNSSYTDSYRTNLYALRDKLSHAKQLLLRASTICREDFITGSSCQMAKDEIYSSSINSNLDVIAIEDASFIELLPSISDMSIEHDVVLDISGVVPRVRFSWAAANVGSCNVELTNADGEPIVYLHDTDLEGEVFVSPAEVMNGTDGSGTLLLAVANVDCTDLLASGNIEASQSLDVFEGVDFTDFMHLVLVDFSSDLYSLKLEYANQYDGECFIKARYHFINHQNNTYGDAWTEYHVVNKNGSPTDISTSFSDTGYEYEDYAYSEVSFSELEAPPGYSQSGDDLLDPYKFMCISAKLIRVDPDRSVDLELSYVGESNLIWCNAMARNTPYTDRPNYIIWSDASQPLYFKDDHVGTLSVYQFYHEYPEAQFVIPVEAFITCVPDDDSSRRFWYTTTPSPIK